MANQMDSQVTTIVIVGMVGGFAIVGRLLNEFFGRRGGGGRFRRDAAGLEAIGQQLAALQQSVDATAIEVERLGEGLRFTTKLLAERNGAPSRETQRESERVITPH
jgi:hypothetical protein